MLYFVMGDMSNRAHWLRMAKYSSSSSHSEFGARKPPQLDQSLVLARESMRGWNGVSRRRVRKCSWADRRSDVDERLMFIAPPPSPFAQRSCPARRKCLHPDASLHRQGTGLR